MKTLIYLAAPYTYEGKHTGYVVLERFLKINQVAGELFQKGFLVFSPISHTHPIKETNPDAMSGGWEFWEEYDRKMISVCDEVLVYCLPGWESSVGVQNEIKIAYELGKPVKYYGL